MHEITQAADISFRTDSSLSTGTRDVRGVRNFEELLVLSAVFWFFSFFERLNNNNESRERLAERDRNGVNVCCANSLSRGS